MSYFSVAEIAKKWNMSERSVRNYCAQGLVAGAFLAGKTWNILRPIWIIFGSIIKTAGYTKTC